MATMVRESKAISNVLNRLIELDLESVSAYDTAIDHIDDLDDKACFESFKGDLERQVHDLQAIVTEAGDKPTLAADYKRHLKNAKVILAALIGDRLVLLALKVIERDVVNSYEKALDHEDLPSHVRETLHRFKEEARRHVADLEKRLDNFDASETKTFTPPPSVR